MIVGERADRFRSVLIRGATGDTCQFSVLPIFKIEVIAHHIPNPDHPAGKFVIAAIQNIASTPVYDFADFAEIGDIVPHEIINCITFTGEFTDFENSGLGIVIERGFLIELIDQSHVARLGGSVGIFELIVR